MIPKPDKVGKAGPSRHRIDHTEGSQTRFRSITGFAGCEAVDWPPKNPPLPFKLEAEATIFVCLLDVEMRLSRTCWLPGC